jgi:hypothetical protein
VAKDLPRRERHHCSSARSCSSHDDMLDTAERM